MATAIAVGIIANSVTEILKKLSSVVANEITLVWDFNDELKNLQSTLNMILDVMEDAEKKQLSQPAVRRWMKELKAIAYDAEDILDDYSYEVNLFHKREKEEEIKSTMFNKVRKIISSSKPSLKVIRKLAKQIKKINENFNKIAERKNNLGLHVGSSSSEHELMMMNRETYSFLPEDWKIVGRENDKSTIIKMLLEEEEENSSNNQGDGGKHVSVIPIVGMGGLGKTAMAQLVYNDEAVHNHFQKKIWICVSVPFEVKKLLTNIASSFGVIATQYDDIVCQLREALRGKKFLLVLDDVWNEIHADWHKLKTPLMGGAKGSKILVTARSVEVAVVIKDKFSHYELGILNHNDSWSLFEQLTFGYVNGVEVTPKLVEIGKEMVKRCGGLPLAVIFLGSLMRSKKTEEQWKKINDTKIWHEYGQGKNNEILPSLRLSYDYLPWELKLCFSYCCLFPKDMIIKREKLIRLWMAEGFLNESLEENAISMDEIGNEYFNSLLSNFFFQDAVKDEDGDIATCKMHDLVHDLARSVIGNHECLIVEKANDIDHIPEETRRLNLLVDLGDEERLAKVLKALKKAKNLRTILVESQSYERIDIDIGDAFKKNKRLRVLDLSGSLVRKTSSIGSLKHLRYLVARDARFSKGIGRLIFLQTLSEFKVGDKKNASGIEELEGLNLLSGDGSRDFFSPFFFGQKGDFSIYNLENVTNEIDARRANLKEKKNLRRLDLFWDPRRANTTGCWRANANNDEAVLEELQPHPNLIILQIHGYYGSKFPRWMGDSNCLPNLVELTLYGRQCEQVAGFGALPSLRYLTLQRMKKVECIGNEFYYSTAAGRSSAAATTTIPFPSLKMLSLRGLYSLKEWVVPAVPSLSTTGATANCFPLLEEIHIIGCSSIFITPTTITFPSLKVLDLKGIEVMEVETLVTNHLNSLTSLTLTGIRNLISLPRQGLIENNNTLLSLDIQGCVEFEGFFPPNNEEEGHDDQGGEGGGGQQLQQISQVASSSSSSSSSLQSLTLIRCPALRYYPNFRSLTSLQTLAIQECKESESLLTYLSSSSSSSSLEHLEHVMIREKHGEINIVAVSEWRKSSSFQGMKH